MKLVIHDLNCYSDVRTLQYSKLSAKFVCEQVNVKFFISIL